MEQELERLEQALDKLEYALTRLEEAQKKFLEKTRPEKEKPLLPRKGIWLEYLKRLIEEKKNTPFFTYASLPPHLKSAPTLHKLARNYRAIEVIARKAHANIYRINPEAIEKLRH